MGSSIFAAMSRITFTSMPRASFTSMPSEDRTNGEFSIVIGSAYHNYHYFASTNTCRYPNHHIQVWHWLWHQYGVPISPEWVRHLLYPICHSHDLTHPQSSMALVDDGFAAYAGRREGLSSKVEELVMQFIVLCDYGASFDADKSVMYTKWCGTAVTLALKVREGNIITCT